MPNAKDYEGGNKQLLALGLGGGGKTTGLLTLPGKKFMYIFDPHALESLQGFDVDYEVFLPERIDLDAVTLKKGVRDQYSSPADPKTFVNFEQHLESSIESGFFDQYDIVGFDSLTTLTDITYDRIMFLNGRFGGWPQVDDHTAVIGTQMKIIRTITALGKFVYVTGHVDQKTNAAGDVLNQPAAVGRMRYRLPLIFSDIWHFYAKADLEDKVDWFVRTAPSDETPYLRTSIKGLNSVENVTIDWSRDPVGQGIGRLGLKRAT